MDELEDVVEVRGAEEWELVDGALTAKSLERRITVELSLPESGIAADSLPFLSFRAMPARPEATEVVYYWDNGGSEERGGRATLQPRGEKAAVCVDLSKIGFAEADLAGEQAWGGPTGRITRIELNFPAGAGESVALEWVRLGPNYDLRAVPEDVVAQMLEDLDLWSEDEAPETTATNE
jgi:hypothetical protein